MMHRSWIIGHRGDGEKNGESGFRENTMDSFAAALSSGADALETDLALTADNEIIFYHDPNVVSGKKKIPPDRISRHNLRQLDSALPDWDEVMTRFPQAAFVLEIKSHTPWQKLVHLLLNRPEWKNPERFRVISFRPEILLYLKSLHSDISCGLIATALDPFSPWVTRRQIRWCVNHGIEEISGHFRLFSSDKIRQAIEAGLKVGLGPIDTPSAFQKAYQNGVHYLYTNRIRWLRARLYPEIH